MAYFGQSNNSLQVPVNPELADYFHASKTFLPNGYQLTPRLKFLFHVYFNINTTGIPQLQAAYGAGTTATIGLMVKTVDLPKFKIDTTTLNQYNRKRLIQSKIHYEPSRITFHDDQSDLIRNLWYNYYSYYYKDPSEPYNNVSATSGSIGQIATLSNGFSYNTPDQYSPVLQTADWGYIGESPADGTNNGTNTTGKPQFFRDITIYGMSQKKYAAWTLINPIINQWSSDTYDYSEGAGTMANDVTIEFETVKYYSGKIGGEQPSASVSGFASPTHYDTEGSGIATLIGRNTAFGQGGMVNAHNGSTQDLQAQYQNQGGYPQVRGRVQRPGTVYNTSQSFSASQIFGPNIQNNLGPVSRGILPGAMNSTINSANGMFFPRAPLQAPINGYDNAQGQ
jgi:hypothetical protein